jgi:hypothetical protein
MLNEQQASKDAQSHLCRSGTQDGRMGVNRELACLGWLQNDRRKRLSRALHAESLNQWGEEVLREAADKQVA